MDDWMASLDVNIARTVYHGSASFIDNMTVKILDSMAEKVRKG